MKLVRLTKMFLKEKYSKIRVGKYLSDVLIIKNGLKHEDALSPLLFTFTLEYAIRKVEVKQDGLKLNGTHKLLVYADDVDIMGGSVHTIKYTNALLDGSKGIGLEVNVDKTTYIVMSRDQNAGLSHSIKTDNSFLVNVEEIKCLEKP
jgi:hypothetical protein